MVRAPRGPGRDTRDDISVECLGLSHLATLRESGVENTVRPHLGNVLHSGCQLADRSTTMTPAHWCLSVLNAWRIQRAVIKSLRTLRPVNAAVGLPLHRMSGDELDATILNFSRFARLFGTSIEEVAATVGKLRRQHAYAHRRSMKA